MCLYRYVTALTVQVRERHIWHKKLDQLTQKTVRERPLTKPSVHLEQKVELDKQGVTPGSRQPSTAKGGARGYLLAYQVASAAAVENAQICWARQSEEVTVIQPSGFFWLFLKESPPHDFFLPFFPFFFSVRQGARVRRVYWPPPLWAEVPQRVADKASHEQVWIPGSFFFLLQARATGWSQSPMKETRSKRTSASCQISKTKKKPNKTEKATPTQSSKAASGKLCTWVHRPAITVHELLQSASARKLRSTEKMKYVKPTKLWCLA